MADRNDGGQAFPSSFVGPYGTESSKGGMTLRDWFAGQALIGLVSDADNLRKLSVNGKEVAAITARSAYFMADAMLAERAK